MILSKPLKIIAVGDSITNGGENFKKAYNKTRESIEYPFGEIKDSSPQHTGQFHNCSKSFRRSSSIVLSKQKFDIPEYLLNNQYKYK